MGNGMMKTCSVEGCSKPHKAHGWCMNHYYRWRAHGDPCGGGPSHGDAMKFLTETVLNFSGDECLIWPFARARSRRHRGYGHLKIEGKTVQAHRYACEHVHGAAPFPAAQAAHSCGNGHLGCCNPKHVSWKTASENQLDRITHGTDGRGTRNPSAKLTDNDVREIRALEGVKSQREIAKKFGIGQAHVHRIHKRLRWEWLK